jgi:hypothetical protein
MNSELKGWSAVDDYLELVDFLDDDQLYRESDVLFSYHKNRIMGCPYEHTEGSVCFVQNIMEGVEAILDLYLETGNLHPKNRYILCNYLALVQDGQIVEQLV